MNTNDFGKEIRKARIETGQTLASMAKTLGTTPSFLSAMETGRSKIPTEWVTKIKVFFSGLQYTFQKDIEALAMIANKKIPLDGLSQKHQMLLTGFAKSEFTPEQLEKIANVLKEINEINKNKE